MTLTTQEILERKIDVSAYNNMLNFNGLLLFVATKFKLYFCFNRTRSHFPVSHCIAKRFMSLT